MNTIPFSIEEFRKNEKRKVIDEKGEQVEIIRIGLAPQFFRFVQKGIDPTTCYTYHVHRKGSDAYPVLGAGVYKNLSIVVEN